MRIQLVFTMQSIVGLVIIADKEFYADWQRFQIDLFSDIKGCVSEIIKS